MLFKAITDKNNPEVIRWQTRNQAWFPVGYQIHQEVSEYHPSDVQYVVIGAFKGLNELGAFTGAELFSVNTWRRNSHWTHDS